MNSPDYVNAIGGISLYNKEYFFNKDIRLHFLKTENIQYRQFGEPFIASLSIIDMLMFNSVDNVISMVNEKYEFV